MAVISLRFLETRKTSFTVTLTLFEPLHAFQTFIFTIIPVFRHVRKIAKSDY